MSTNERAFLGWAAKFASPESDVHLDDGLPQVIKSLEIDLQSWKSEDVSQTIALLSMIANDGRISLQNPMAVIEALQNHGHLLCDHEVEMLRNWLVQIDRASDQQNMTVGASAK